MGGRFLDRKEREGRKGRQEAQGFESLFFHPLRTLRPWRSLRSDKSGEHHRPIE
jgi:hypothetical protein